MNSDSLVISSRIRLARNLENEPFPYNLTPDRAKAIVSKIKNSILGSNSYISREFEVIDFKTIKEKDKLSLVEKHLLSKEILKSNISECLINKDETISIMINEEDHIRLQVIEKGFNIDEAYDIASKIDDLMEENLRYAFDKNLGYLTSCITNLGTAMRASVMLHLPMLSKNKLIGKIEREIEAFGMTIRGLYGEGSEGFGNIYQVSNQATLGLSEEDIIKNLKIVIEKIINKEILERKEIIRISKEKFEDLILRSFGILKYCRYISTIEALNLISNVRCGVEMGIIKDIDIKDINNITESIQTGNIQRILSKEMTPGERDIQRAKMLNKVFM